MVKNKSSFILDGVGKSSLITALVTEAFPDEPEMVPDCLPPVLIPPSVTPEGVSTQIVDTCEAGVERELKGASVICLVYAVNDRESFDRLSTHWLPLIRSLQVECPIVLVGNKIDVRGDQVTNERLEEEILPLMNEYRQIETCVECSAARLINVAEVFYFAQKAVIHPTAPLYDSHEHLLRPACLEALRRIFRLCDVNNDGLLDDGELNDFQVSLQCFISLGGLLQDSALSIRVGGNQRSCYQSTCGGWH